MLLVTIDNILADRGKTRYWLANTAGIDYVSLIRLCKGQTSRISFEYIEKICDALNCTPGDIMKINNSRP